MSRFIYSRQKNAFQEMVILWLRKHSAPEFKGPVKIWVDLSFKKNRKRDKDNYSPKFLLDALVKYGLIEDDNSKIITEVVDIEFFTAEFGEGIGLKVEEIK